MACPGVGGNDTILADTSTATPDTLEGGGNDDRIVGNARDNVIYGDDQGGVAPSGPAGKDTIFGGNEITGSGGDFIDGGGNNDLLYGEDGDDTVLGDTGNDKMFGGNDFDLLSGDAGNDRMKGDDADTMRGGAGDDTLYGGRDDDSLDGGDDDDLLIGGRGNDSLFGGIGFDLFRFEKPNQGFDTVFDFTQGIDRIQIDQAQFGLSSVVGSGFSVAAEFGNFGSFAAADASIAKIVIVNNVLLFNSDGATAVGSGMIALAMFLTGIPTNASDYDVI